MKNILTDNTTTQYIKIDDSDTLSVFILSEGIHLSEDFQQTGS